ncbi:hypothetical protein ACFL2V_04840 [Pseudomonadota bacterium]
METRTQTVQEKIQQALDLAKDLKSNGTTLGNEEAKLAVDDLINTLADAGDEIAEETQSQAVWSVY